MSDQLKQREVKTGKELYELYCRVWARYGVGCDSWEELEETDRNFWASLALELME